MNAHVASTETADAQVSQTAHSVGADLWSPWRDALAAGKPVDVPRGVAALGYYRSRDGECIAFLPGDNDRPYMWRSSSRRCPAMDDEIAEQFSWVSMYPVSYETATAYIESGRWPDQVSRVETPKELSPDEAAAHELVEQQKAAKAWLLGLKDADGKNRKPATKEEADKAANFANEFQKIEKSAVDKHKAEKAEILKAGREIDTKWFVTRDAAIVAKTWARGLSDEYVKAEQAKRNEEARIANEKAQAEFAAAKARADEQSEQDEALRAKGVVMPEAAPPVAAPKPIVAEKVNIGTSGRKQSLRVIESYEIEDATALLRFLAERNVKSEKLLAAALADGRALQEIGTEVPGLKLVKKEEVR